MLSIVVCKIIKISMTPWQIVNKFALRYLPRVRPHTSNLFASIRMRIANQHSTNSHTKLGTRSLIIQFPFFLWKYHKNSPICWANGSASGGKRLQMNNITYMHLSRSTKCQGKRWRVIRNKGNSFLCRIPPFYVSKRIDYQSEFMCHYGTITTASYVKSKLTHAARYRTVPAV